MTLWERIDAATCRYHGFDSDDEREAVVRGIVKAVLDIRMRA